MKHPVIVIISGATNVEEIQDELDGLLFGQENSKNEEEKQEKSLFEQEFASR